MKRCLFFVFLYYLTTTAVCAQTEVKARILAGSSMKINGTSNVNTFECGLANELESKEIQLQYTEKRGFYVLRGASFFVQVTNFDCGNKIMTTDMHNALREKEYPKMYFELLTIDVQKSTIEILITIAGRTNKYQLQYQQKKNNPDDINVGIHTDFTMSEFGIVPPKVMFGMIKVNDQVSIDLTLILTWIMH